MLPVMAFLERGEEIAAANDLAREFVGSSESMKTGELFWAPIPRREMRSGSVSSVCLHPAAAQPAMCREWCRNLRPLVQGPVWCC